GGDGRRIRRARRRATGHDRPTAPRAGHESSDSKPKREFRSQPAMTTNPNGDGEAQTSQPHGRARHSVRAEPSDVENGAQGTDAPYQAPSDTADFAARLNPSALFIRRPVMTTLVMLGILFFGTMSYRLLPVSDLPNVDFPTVLITESLPGANADTMASAVATPLERPFSTT